MPITLCLNGTSKVIRPEWNWRGPPGVAFAVDDIPAVIAKCPKRGVKILIPPVESRDRWMAWIADPAGNRICLHPRKDGPPG